MTTELLQRMGDAIARAAERVGPATVAIGRRPRGSGLVVAKDRVLTNAHNLRDRTTEVHLAEHHAQGEVLAVDAATDLAVLVVDTGDVPPAPWSEHSRTVGTPVVAVARGVGTPRASFGFVAATDRAFRGPGGRPIGRGIEHTAPMARGSSGGPLVDLDGAVVGLNTHRLGEGFYLAQDADAAFVARLEQLLQGRAAPRAELGIAVAPAEVARRLRRSVGLDERDGVLVREVHDPSAALRAGLREGDLVVGAGDRPVESIDALHLVLGEHDPSAPLDLRVVRGADELTLTVHFESDADERQD